jgi:hypothetical protein
MTDVIRRIGLNIAYQLAGRAAPANQTKLDKFSNAK